MKKIEVSTTFSVYDSINDLPQEIHSLMLQAIEIRKKAYAPYSRFRVGAALLLDNGKVVLGSNQENAAFPSGLCAERTALFHAGAVYPDARILKIAISAAADERAFTQATPPCGACRQAIAEYEFKQEFPVEIYFMGSDGEVLKSDSLKNLLPLTFDKNFL